MCLPTYLVRRGMRSFIEVSKAKQSNATQSKTKQKQIKAKHTKAKQHHAKQKQSKGKTQKKNNQNMMFCDLPNFFLSDWLWNTQENDLASLKTNQSHLTQGHKPNATNIQGKKKG